MKDLNTSPVAVVFVAARAPACRLQSARRVIGEALTAVAGPVPGIVQGVTSVVDSIGHRRARSVGSVAESVIRSLASAPATRHAEQVIPFVVAASVVRREAVGGQPIVIVVAEIGGRVTVRQIVNVADAPVVAAATASAVVVIKRQVDDRVASIQLPDLQAGHLTAQLVVARVELSTVALVDALQRGGGAVIKIARHVGRSVRIAPDQLCAN